MQQEVVAGGRDLGRTHAAEHCTERASGRVPAVCLVDEQARRAQAQEKSDRSHGDDTRKRQGRGHARSRHAAISNQQHLIRG